MKSFGLQMSGNFIIEKLETLPVFTFYDEGRLIYSIEDKSYYIGGISSWILIGQPGSPLTRHALSFGTSINDISANCIPVQDIDNTFRDPSSIYFCLLNLSNGLDLGDHIIVERHISDRAISKRHLNLGFNDDQISAKSIICQNPNSSISNPLQTSIQDYINELINLTPFINRQKVQISAWQYDIVNEEYSVVVNYNTIKKDPMIVQCWDDSNHLFTPSKICYKTTLNQIVIYSPYKLDMTVVLMG